MIAYLELEHLSIKLGKIEDVIDDVHEVLAAGTLHLDVLFLLPGERCFQQQTIRSNHSI